MFETGKDHAKVCFTLNFKVMRIRKRCFLSSLLNSLFLKTNQLRDILQKLGPEGKNSEVSDTQRIRKMLRYPSDEPH